MRANPFHRVCLFCNFVTNAIYVMAIEMLEPVFMASNMYSRIGKMFGKH
jgi:hypothetical protein